MTESNIKTILAPLQQEEFSKCDDWSYCRKCGMKFKACKRSWSRFPKEFMEWLKNEKK